METEVTKINGIGVGTRIKYTKNSESDYEGKFGTVIELDCNDNELPYLCTVDGKDNYTSWMYPDEIVRLDIKTEFYGKPVTYLGGNKWAHVYEFADHSYTFLHEPKWDDFGIGILPYRFTEGKGFEYLGVMEIRPVHGNKHHLYALTGGYDDKSLTTKQCAIKELKEETGYIATEDDVISFGETFITKMSTGRMELFIVDVTNLPQFERTTDGSAVEETAYPRWVTADELVLEGDHLLAKLYALQCHHMFSGFKRLAIGGM